MYHFPFFAICIGNLTWWCTAPWQSEREQTGINRHGEPTQLSESNEMFNENESVTSVGGTRFSFSGSTLKAA